MKLAPIHFIFLGLVAITPGCFVSHQDFEFDSEDWILANPVISTYAEDGPRNFNVKVGVIDTGIDYFHPNFNRRLSFQNHGTEHWPVWGLGLDLVGSTLIEGNAHDDFWPFYKMVLHPDTDDGPDSVTDISTDVKHGTLVSGLIANLTKSVESLGLKYAEKIGIVPIRIGPMSLKKQIEPIKQELIARANNGQTPFNDPKVAKQFLVQVDEDFQLGHNMLQGLAFIEGLKRSLDFLVSNKVQVANLSIGIDLRVGTVPVGGLDLTEEWITRHLTPNWKKWESILLVVAAGNESMSVEGVNSYIPANLQTQNKIVVGALDAVKNGKQRIACYSNFGETVVDIYIRGSDLNSSTPNADSQNIFDQIRMYEIELKENRIKNKFCSGKYCLDFSAKGFTDKASGTSFSSPLIAALAAKVLYHRPELSSTQLKDFILKHSDWKTLPQYKCGKNDQIDDSVPPIMRKVRVANINRILAEAKKNL